MIVVGKPVTSGDAVNTGYIDPNALVKVLQGGMRAVPGWTTGVMGWQYSSDVDSWSGKWVATLRQAWASSEESSEGGKH